MTLSLTHTVAFHGIEALPVDVEVHITSGIPAFTIVGLPDKAVAESRERVRSALTAIGMGLPPKRITVNLAPADLPKEGSHFDLPIALGIMAALKAIRGADLENYTIIGELGLDGSLRAVAGALPAAVQAHAHGKGLICPKDCGAEAAWSGLGDKNAKGILAPKNLVQLVNHFAGTQILSPPKPQIAKAPPAYADISDIRGQESAKRALEIAAAGGHNLLMMGPPGAGKSMLAQRLSGLLPPLNSQEILDVSMIASISGSLTNGGAISHQRPFRAPHHSASMAAMVGGGVRAKPGEVSLAHMGVLFLDEFPEFTRQVLDSLRQPLEDGITTVARANNHITYPSQCQLIAAMNPCRCGYATEPARACKRLPQCMLDYQSKISGPLLDRIDLRVEMPAVAVAEISSVAKGETSKTVAARIANARQIQTTRYKDHAYNLNARASGDFLTEIATPDAQGQELLDQAALKMGLTARGYHRVLRVARTAADLENVSQVRAHHIAEALTYRMTGSFFDKNVKALKH